jgi:hypothetical protein
MEPADLLRYLAQAMEALGMTYLVTGSTATIVYLRVDSEPSGRVSLAIRVQHDEHRV